MLQIPAKSTDDGSQLTQDVKTNTIGHLFILNSDAKELNNDRSKTRPDISKTNPKQAVMNVVNEKSKSPIAAPRYSKGGDDGEKNLRGSMKINIPLPDVNVGRMMEMPILRKIPDVNAYQQKKILAQGMMDLALLSANANQLRYVMEAAGRHQYYYPCLICISTSIFLQECSSDISEMELHAEIDHLKRHLGERDAHIEAMETEFHKGNTRITELEEKVSSWREKYDRLYDSHQRVQRLNQSLEEKLLQMADKCTDDKSQLTRDVETLSVRLAETNYTIGHLHKENERYKNDMNLAIQLLQCKPDNFVSQKFDSLPAETQARVSSYIMSKAKLNQDPASFTLNGKNNSITEKVNPDDFEFNISASLMSKILEESVQNTISSHCETCTCLKKSMNPFSFGDSRYSVGTQTVLKMDPVSPLCSNCNYDLNSLKSNISINCNSPFPAKLLNDDIEALYIEKDRSSPKPIQVIIKNMPNDNHYVRSNEQNFNKHKNCDESIKIVNLKQKEPVSKIGNDVKEHYGIPAMEPITGHHRLCDRTKVTTSTYAVDNKYESDNDYINRTTNKMNNHSPHVNNSVKSMNSSDLIFGQIENSVLIPNLSLESNMDPPVSKSDLNSINSKRMFHGSSISSNDAESKTSSNKSNPKIQIGPGPRFCSLIMQAGSKNILLDNAQPNIAPVLYTRQSRNADTNLTSVYNNDDVNPPMKNNADAHKNDFNFAETISNGKSATNSQTINSYKVLDSIDNILDLPNEDLLIKDPMVLSEKPESGYKSNESAEIIDKLLFGVDNIKDHGTKLDNTNYKNDDPKKDVLIKYDVYDEKKLNMKDPIVIDSNVKSESLLLEQNDNVKVFNFDHYERSLKCSSGTTQQENNLINLTNVTATESIKVTNDSHSINENTELFNNSFDLKMASKNLSEINKKFQTPNPSDNLTLDNPKPKEWKKDTSTEKSSSSLSSDDSAALLQKQQLIRVAEWVQKNLEMEQQAEFESSDVSCHQSAEEMHHVRNDFPRPAKVDHRLRKNPKINHKISHHISKQTQLTKINDAPDTFTPHNEKLDLNVENKYNFVQHTIPVEVSENSVAEEIDFGENDRTPITTYSTPKSYSKEELAQMEHNVKQFLMNGTRWGSGATNSYRSGARRTSSKTETDL